MDNINVNQQKSRKDVSGCNNPMYGRHHSQQSREKMSRAATLRNQQYKKAINNLNNQHISMDELLGCTKMEEYIKELTKKVINEQINKIVWRKQNQRIQIPNNWE